MVSSRSSVRIRFEARSRRGLTANVKALGSTVLPGLPRAARKARAQGPSTRVVPGRAASMRTWRSGSAPPCQGGGRGFESRCPLQTPRSQAVAREVPGESPAGPSQGSTACHALVVEWQTRTAQDRVTRKGRESSSLSERTQYTWTVGTSG